MESTYYVRADEAKNPTYVFCDGERFKIERPWTNGNYFCHVTLQENKESIRQNGLIPNRAYSVLYDGFLPKTSLKGIWWTVRQRPLEFSCYPFAKDQSKVFEFNPMLYFHHSHMIDLGHDTWHWFRLDKRQSKNWQGDTITNVKIACIPERLLDQVPPGYEVLNKKNNEYFCSGPDGYYIPRDENYYLSVFVVCESPFPSENGEWEDVKKI